MTQSPSCNSPFSASRPPFRLLGTSGGARWGRLETAHGIIETPVFMPVGTAGTVKAMDPDTVSELGAHLIVCNTYHLYLRPGHRLVEQLGGLRRFMHYSGSILTDSGGYQVFSMRGIRGKISDEGVSFRSHLDGSHHLLTSELSMEVQHSLGSDIVMMFDECAPYPCSKTQALVAQRRTTTWARLCREIFERRDDGRQLLFPIIQGSVFQELRMRSLADLVEMELPGYAIGGLSVGESRGLMLEVLEWLTPEMPKEKPRYLMGVGRPWDIVEAVARGVDMFDCVLPTRVARNGGAYTSEGRLNIKNSRFRDDVGPLDPECSCSTCTRFCRAYLRHLHVSGEILAAILLTHHNLSFYLHLMKKLREAIKEDCFSQLCRDLEPALKEPASALAQVHDA